MTQETERKKGSAQGKGVKKASKPRNWVVVYEEFPVDVVQKQLDLFSALTVSSEETEKLGNVIDLYDILPRFLHSKKTSENLNEESLVRRVRHRGSEYVMEIVPALLKKEGKPTRLVFPSRREEAVEHVVRKFATMGLGVADHNKVSVQFRLNDVYRELRERGHTHSWAEIKEAIEVLHNARLKISSSDGRVVASATMFPFVVEARPDSDDVTTHYYSVTLYPLVTRAIIQTAYRRFNYALHLSIRNHLARYLHGRLSSLWTQASNEFPYSFRLLSMLEQSARGVGADMSGNVRAMKLALENLIEKKVIREYTEERLKKGNKILDIRYSLYPHEDFIREMKGHNFHAKTLRLSSGEQPELGSDE